MKFLGVLVGLVLLMVTPVSLANSADSAGVSGARTVGKVFWIDLAGTARQHPGFVYFTANAGGQVRGVGWKNWGQRRAIGRGTFRDTSANFPGKPDREGPAKLIAWKPIRCVPEFGTRQGRSVRVYRHVRLWYPNGRGGRMSADVSQTAGFLTCR